MQVHEQVTANCDRVYSILLIVILVVLRRQVSCCGTVLQAVDEMIIQSNCSVVKPGALQL